MEDKTFELLEKMYSEFTGRFEKLESGQAQVIQRLGKLEAGQVKLETTLEHDIKDKLHALNERAAANTDRLQEHSERLNTIENKLDYLALSVNSHDKRLEVVETPRMKKVK